MNTLLKKISGRLSYKLGIIFILIIFFSIIITLLTFTLIINISNRIDKEHTSIKNMVIEENSATLEKLAREKIKQKAIDVANPADNISSRAGASTYLDEFMDSSMTLNKKLTIKFDNTARSLQQLFSLVYQSLTILVIIILILIVAVFIFLYRYILIPIRDLSAIANQINNGNYQIKPDLRSNDEIGELALSFKKMTQKLIQHNQKLKAKVTSETSKIKSFVSIASHQLRTPLTGVKWFIEMLIKNPEKNLTKQQLSLLTHVYDSNSRMINLVNDILNVSKIDVVKAQLSLQKSNIYNIITTILKDNIDLITKNKIKILNHIHKKLVLNIDQEKITQVFHNLISNAIKYSSGKVEINCQINKNEIIFSISDNGLGIPASQLSRLFQKFFRADNVRHTNIEGTGLGLYIAKKMIESHGGKIWYKNAPPQGSIFYFSLSKKYFT